MRTLILFISSVLILSSSLSAQLGWFNQRQEGETILYSIDMYDRDHVTAVGSDGVILQSNDAGVNWQSKPSGATDNLRRIRWYSPTLGVILGNAGLALKSVDGGASWQPMNTGSTKVLLDIHFFDTNNWMVIGQAEQVLTTSDAGASWEDQGSGTNNLNEIAFIGNIGIIVGNKGTIHTTTNGGQRWRDRSGITGLELTSVSISDDSIAVAVGSNGTIIRSDDKGDSWTRISASVPISSFRLTGVRHLTKENLVLCGNGGLILWSTDTGLSWYSQESNTQENLEALEFIDSKVGVAAGWNGTIIRTNSGGTLAVKRLAGAAPERVGIGESWPNPLSRNSQANVNIALPRGGDVQLRVYDLLGRERKSVVSSSMDAGTFTISWDSSSLQKGVYLYHLEQHGSVQVRKFTIVD
ncbi:MAG: YCF48-related protein [Bacteroidota bacterium]